MQYLSKDTIFDIKAFYQSLRAEGINPHSVEAAEVVSIKVIKRLTQQAREVQESWQAGKPKFLVIESSGLNKTINGWLNKVASISGYPQFPVITILVCTPKKVIEERIRNYTGPLTFNPTEFNKLFWEQFEKGYVLYDMEYFPVLNLFFPAFDLKKLRKSIQP
jgi:hypothetical protein